MNKRPQRKETFMDRLRDLLADLDRLFNPPKPVAARIPVRVKDR